MCTLKLRFASDIEAKSKEERNVIDRKGNFIPLKTFTVFDWVRLNILHESDSINRTKSVVLNQRYILSMFFFSQC